MADDLRICWHRIPGSGHKARGRGPCHLGCVILVPEERAVQVPVPTESKLPPDEPPLAGVPTMNLLERS